MRAPVYRNIETRNTLLGLAFPGEVFVVFAVYWIAILASGPGTALVSTIAATVAIRVIGYGRPPMFSQHYVTFIARRAIAGGRFCAAARCNSPRFPHAPHVIRDVARKASP